MLLKSYSVRVIGVCEVISRVGAPFFNDAALVLKKYPRGVLTLFPMFSAGVIGALRILQLTRIHPTEPT